IRIVKSAESKGVIAPEVIDLVKQQLGEKFGEDKLWSLGTEVHTTIDPKIQEIARRSLEKGLEEIDAREGFSKPLAHLDGKKLAAPLKQLGKDVGDAPKTGSVYEGVVTATDDGDQSVSVDLGSTRGILPLGDDHRYNQKKLPPSKRFKAGDVIRVRPTGEKTHEGEWVLIPEFGPQAAMVVIEPETRQIKALGGGYGYVAGSYARLGFKNDPRRGIHRQPGSSFKPFLYATAFDSRKYTPASMVNDAPEVYALWKPQNDEKESFRGPV